METLSEAMPMLRLIAEIYDLKLSNLKHFKIAANIYKHLKN